MLVASSKKKIQENVGDLWDSQKVQSDDNIHVIYDGAPIKSRMFCYWKVKVWDKNNNPSEWSNQSHWSMGLLKSSDWLAKWIGEPPQKRPNLLKRRHKKKPREALMLRKEFFLDDSVSKAILYASALGEYILKINGKRVGNRFLAPEWTNYTKRIQYQTYDVTKYLRVGENVIGVVLGDGWYAGHIGPGYYYHSHYGINRIFIGQLSIKMVDGQTKLVLSDKTWKMYDGGPIVQADHFHGEVHNLEKEESGWDQGVYNDSQWKEVSIDGSVTGELVAQMNEPIRIIKEIIPIKITSPKSGVFIFDMGQNLAGWCKIRPHSQLFEEDAIITLRHGEMLKEDGTLYTENLRTAEATDKYILNGNYNDWLHPFFTYHGFRYVEITGFKPNAKPNKDLILGCAISSDTKITGNFKSSHSKLNKLWKNVVWTQRDNLMSVPTDCPQRDERMGWLGDAQVFAQTSIFNMDMAAFYSKWIKDIRTAQRQNGVYPKFAPYPLKHNHKFPFTKIVASPGWSDCGIILPWLLYLNYGDKRVLEEHYESAKKYVDYLIKKNPDYLWKYHYFSYVGDWLNGDQIESEGYPEEGAEISRDVFSTVFYAISVGIVSKMADILGKKLDHQKYLQISQNIKTSFNSEFINENGKIGNDSQAAYALALYFNLIDENMRFKALSNLKKTIKRYDERLSTGFCTTHRLMLLLARSNLHDLSCR